MTTMITKDNFRVELGYLGTEMENQIRGYLEDKYWILLDETNGTRQLRLYSPEAQERVRRQFNQRENRKYFGEVGFCAVLLCLLGAVFELF